MYVSSFRSRDPFILPCKTDQTYYLYGSTDPNLWNGPAEGFDYYKSSDLEHWDGPYPAFRAARDFWADRHFWAPEVHVFRSKYYMLASFKSGSAHRGTQALVSDTPSGPFVPVGTKPITPSGWECLDGTLHVDNTGRPWLVFCHEWTQVEDGEICAMPLTKDLDPAGEAVLLFRASDAVWSNVIRVEFEGKRYENCRVTDGPFLHRTQNGSLVMLWSSMGSGGYTLGWARSLSGTVTGPWEQVDTPLFTQDGGHGMLFYTFDGQLLLAMHSPNKNPDERLLLLQIDDSGGALKVPGF